MSACIKSSQSDTTPRTKVTGCKRPRLCENSPKFVADGTALHIDHKSASDEILSSHLGIDMNTDHTLEKVGAQFGVTREGHYCVLPEQLRETRIRILGNGIGKGLHFEVLVVELGLGS